MSNEEKLNEEKEVKTTGENPEPETEETAPDTISASEETDYKALYEAMNDKYLRLYSEFDNFRRRTARERLDLIKSAGSDVVTAVLPVLDDFERAVKANETATDLDLIREGTKLIYHKLFAILQAKGLKMIEVQGEAFDSDLAEAIANIPVEDEAQKGKVIEVVENGYYLNEVVIRYAKVVVGQ